MAGLMGNPALLRLVFFSWEGSWSSSTHLARRAGLVPPGGVPIQLSELRSTRLAAVRPACPSGVAVLVKTGALAEKAETWTALTPEARG